VHYFELSKPSLLLGSTAMAPALLDALGTCDVVHIHGLFNRTVWDAAAVLQAAGKPYVLSPRGMLEAPALAHHVWRKRVSWLLNDHRVVTRAHLLHASSSFEATTLRRFQGSARVVQVANPVSVERVTTLDATRFRASLGLSANEPIVLVLGRLHRIKRVDLVASAFLLLRKQIANVQLVMAGPDEQHLRPALERQLAEAGASVHWMGPVADAAKASVLAAATVLVQCSDSESFGMSVAEALAAGTPVVVTRTCPWPEIEEFRCGLWVDQRAEAIATGLSAIVSDPESARAMGGAGRRLVEDRMSPPRVAEAWRSVYTDLARLNPAAA
jgi:glycosyltransferase involved in cell wall biosynthesis